MQTKAVLRYSKAVLMVFLVDKWQRLFTELTKVHIIYIHCICISHQLSASPMTRLVHTGLLCCL